ncbi:hypothetical protein BTA51_06915 [Hahella sp. CCB-MM4]|uniref:hypothetical protein n=1 Tax=Hahella sp. (strain CCB-MM4) TaxID=1926491 RepID=UPI000B9A9CAB|nr:hypothetical protein [Hahella sp. CCB-MM4]OZG74822.1 hypothetical protein BTA51_06915 [Hahella sp. CCB-MM4]
MIVFTATDKVSGKIFAGSTRQSLEDHWDSLLTKESEGAMGEFFETLRESGVDAFKLEEWGYSDNPKELREMLAEAMEDLGALPIKPVLGSVRKVEVKAANAVMQELEELKQAMESGDPDDDFEPVSKSAGSEKPAGQEKVEVAVKPKAADPKPLRQTRSTEEAAEMRALIAGIEARRRAGLKSNRKAPGKKSVSSAIGKVTGTAQKASASGKSGAESTTLEKPKLSVGRSSSSAKEKRIREAIAAEKADMESQKRSQAAAEAQEMREIMAKLDERAKTAARIHRRM